MARSKNDGRGRLGGREKGTPNKITAELREWVQTLLSDGRGKFVESMAELPASEYVRIYAAMLSYALPKMQAVSLEADITHQQQEPEKQLSMAEIRQLLKELDEE